MTAGVYAIVNTVNGMAYIGSSVNIELRWVSHQSALRKGIGPSSSMVGDWQANGPKAFEWRIVETTAPTDDALEQAEQRWMNLYADRAYHTRRTAIRPRPSSLYLDLDGVRLQARREALGLTVMQLSWKIPVTDGTLLKWEKGRPMRPSMRKRVERVLQRLERRTRAAPEGTP